MKKTNSSQSQSELLTRLSQEINAPLKTLSSSSKKLLDNYRGKDFEYISYKDFKQLLSTLEQMNKQIQRCYTSMQSLIKPSQSDLKGGSCDLNALINQILKQVKPQLLNLNIKMILQLGKSIPLVNLNPIDMHQVVHNILSNAMNAMPAGGIIRIRTLWDEASKMVHLEIVDSGVGIPQQRLSKIFEPFVTTKDQGVEKSSGLGLSIVYSLVNGCGGAIHIQSSLRKGTQVKISLPAASL